MTTLLSMHAADFNAREGCFTKDATAHLVAGRINRLLDGLGYAVPERFIQVVKSGKNFTVEIPRLRHVWWPKRNDQSGIANELVEIRKLMKEAYPDETH